MSATPHDELIAEGKKTATALFMNECQMTTTELSLHVTKLVVALESARADGERLDWLDSCGCVSWDKDAPPVRISTPMVLVERSTIRAAIDKARGIKP